MLFEYSIDAKLKSLAICPIAQNDTQSFVIQVP